MLLLLFLLLCLLLMLKTLDPRSGYHRLRLASSLSLIPELTAVLIQLRLLSMPICSRTCRMLLVCVQSRRFSLRLRLHRCRLSEASVRRML